MTPLKPLASEVLAKRFIPSAECPVVDVLQNEASEQKTEGELK